MLDPELILNGFAKIDHQDDYFSRTIPKVVFDNSNKLLYIVSLPCRVINRVHSKLAINMRLLISAKNFKYYGPLEKKSTNEAIEDIEIS